MKNIYILDENEELKKQLKDVLKRNKEIKLKQYTNEKFKKILDSIPDILIINEDTLPKNMKVEEICKKIREDEDNSITPIIVISSKKDRAHKIEILKNEVDLYVEKPIDEEILYYNISNIIRLLNSNRMVSPLTGLPGNVQIQAEMKKRLSNKKRYTMLYIDLDNFKAYNDTYGFSKGDEIIKFTAKLILKNVMKNEDNFVGHIGGDDFVAISEDDDYENICQNIIAEFDTQVKKFFTEEDFMRGYLEVENRKGIIEEFPITSISIGAIEVTKDRFKNTLEVGEAGANVKHLAKTIFGSTYVIDRRKNREEIYDKAEKKVLN